MTSSGTAPMGEEPQVLTCPACAKVHEGTIARIGNRKTKCAVCNRFSQTVRRHVARALMEAHPDEVPALRAAAEQHAYGMVVGRLTPVPVPPKAEPQPCSIEDCKRVGSAKGYCRMHYKRLLATGDPLQRSRFANQAEKDAHIAAERAARLVGSTDWITP